MEFPHLNDTKFPNLNTVDVYAYKNVFDYTRWEPNTKIYLTNVRWNGDYQDVVKFEDDAARDDWFDKKVEESDCSTTITSNTVIINGTVKVPMPYDVASQYNYLVVDVPVMTSNDKMIDYETADGYRRWHFFVTDFAYGSPSATTLTLTLDFWTQYINSVGISYMFLERGHAPVAETDTDSYLSNPVENTKYLLAPDVNYGNDTVARGGKFVPFGNGEKYVCFVSVCPPSNISEMGKISYSGTWSDYTISDGVNQPDGTGRWNHEHEVNGYNWGNGKSYQDTKTPARNALSNASRGLNNRTIYAIAESNASGFVNDVQDKCPMFLNTVKACFIVAKEMLYFSGTQTIAGHSVSVVGGAKETFDLDSVKLTKSMFGIQDEYSRFAKLYTYPYSELEITDNNGKSVTVRVETTGNIQAHGMSCLIYPYLNLRMFLTGIGGIGSDNYQWKDMLGTHNESISKSDWYRFCFDSEVPTFELYMDGETSWELGNYNRTFKYGREQAINNYKDNNEALNNARENAYDLADKNKTNAYNSADAAKRNAYNTTSAARQNAYNDSYTMSSNHSNMRSCASQITANNNSATTANTVESNNYALYVYRALKGKEDWETSYNNQINKYTTTEENKVTVAAANNSAIATGIGAGANILAGTASGGLTGAISSMGQAVGDMAGAVMNQAQSMIVTQASENVTQATNTRNLQFAINDGNVNFNLWDYKNSQSTNVNSNNVNAATANTNASNNCDSSNTANTTSTMRTNADNSYNAATTNADNSYNAATTNANNDRDTARSNASYTAWQAGAANWRMLTNAQNNAKSLGADAYNYRPVTVCNASGDPTPDAHRTRGIQVKVRTQSEDAIAQTASEFARYGYKLNQIYNPESLTLMKHFTYWKTRECWVYDKCETNDTAQTAISIIFNKGVTVWGDPDEIGKVNPYDN